MASNFDKYKDDLKALLDQGTSLLFAMQNECFPENLKKQIEEDLKENYKEVVSKYKEVVSKLPSFKGTYQEWYSESLVLIKFLLPDRLADFIKLYEKPKNRKNAQYGNYVIEDYLQGLTVTSGNDIMGMKVVVDSSAAIPQFQQQLNILKSAEKRFVSSLFDLEHLVQADLFDSELDAAKELVKNGFFRAAGVIAGVVLERHLSQVCSNHQISIKKKDPTISVFNDALKNNNVFDVPEWRRIQHLGDLRNLCGHNKAREPKKEEIEDLIDGVAKTIKNLF